MTTSHYFNTLQLHADNEPVATANSPDVPNYQTSSYVFNNSDYGYGSFLIETTKHSQNNQKLTQKLSEAKHQKNIGLFGFGCVGQGFYQLLNRSNLTSQVKSIVIKNEYIAREIGHALFTTDHSQSIHDAHIKTIIEVINNPQQAFNIAHQAVTNDKNLITANKKMVALNLAQIIEWNENSDSSILYEAAVAGSIPIIRNLDSYFDVQATNNIRAIVNGSSNYILTQMFANNSPYDKALQYAQKLGYAELDPIDDVAGFDAKYKAVILAAHAFGLLCHPDEVNNFGIQNIQLSDIDFARKHGLSIKLVVNIITKGDKSIGITVMPQFVDSKDELAKVENENNVVIVNNNGTDFLFHGAGAGSIATGTAVLADLTASQKNYRYQYHIDNQLVVSNDFKLKVYINKTGFNEAIIGDIIEQTNGYLIAEINYHDLIQLNLENNFVAIIGN